MPASSTPVLRAADLRLVHACVKIARINIVRACQDQEDMGIRGLKACETIRQAEAVLDSEMRKHNIVPALSAQELRDEELPENEIPAF